MNSSSPRFTVEYNSYEKQDEILDLSIGEKFGTFSLQAAAKLLNAYCRPAIQEGELYAGIIIGKDGAPDHHLILLPGTAMSIEWSDAVDWARLNGGELPTRPEQALLYANLQEEFKSAWYWSGTQHAAYSYCAWFQGFSNGNQTTSIKSAELRARAVRRLVIL